MRKHKGFKRGRGFKDAGVVHGMGETREGIMWYLDDGVGRVGCWLFMCGVCGWVVLTVVHASAHCSLWGKEKNSWVAHDASQHAHHRHTSLSQWKHQAHLPIQFDAASTRTQVRAIFAAKGRPADNPLIVHVSSLDMLAALYPPGWSMPPVYVAAVAAHWPGPLTILLPRSDKVWACGP